MSLIENLARRNLSPLELIREVGRLREQGYTYSAIGEKIAQPEYVHRSPACSKRRRAPLDAAERGIIPHTIAAEISQANDEDAAGTDRSMREQLPRPDPAIRHHDDRNLIGKGIKSIRTGKPRTVVHLRGTGARLSKGSR